MCPYIYGKVVNKVNYENHLVFNWLKVRWHLKNLKGFWLLYYYTWGFQKNNRTILFKFGISLCWIVKFKVIKQLYWWTCETKNQECQTNKSSQTFNITKFQCNSCKNCKTICPCKICGLQSVKITQKIHITLM
jgi:hypothetical protein